MKVILIGEPESKRTIYFRKAARAFDTDVHVMRHHEVEFEKLKGSFVKIDPPEYASCYVDEIGSLIQPYKELLQQMEELADVTFLNHPKGILQTLDKAACKKTLKEAQVPVTPVIAQGVTGYLTLKELLCAKKIYRVFIKPNEGSGACGVIAWCYHPGRGQAVAYTGLDLVAGRLVNTKKLKRLTDEALIGELCSRVMELGAIVEGWVPKAQYEGYGYDIRVVHQFGETTCYMPRLSRSPITNLHLNNKAMPVDALNLSKETLEEIDVLCKRAMRCYEGVLNYAGIDVLLEKNTLKPYIIEMNGQGDLLHQDIYHENRIYGMQLLRGVGS
ncbi:MAG: STM4014 family protein [Hungatella sp.]